MGDNLESEGYVVENEARGDEAELRLAENAPDLVAIALFIVIKGSNTLTRQAAKEPTPPAPPTQEVVLLTQIRDELAKRCAARSIAAKARDVLVSARWR